MVKTILVLLLIELSFGANLNKRRRIQDKDKICFIFLHDETSSYDGNFIEAAKDVCQEKGVEAVIKTNIPESDECYNIAKDLAQSGCKAIFADSFGHVQEL